MSRCILGPIKHAVTRAIAMRWRAMQSLCTTYNALRCRHSRIHKSPSPLRTHLRQVIEGPPSDDIEPEEILEAGDEAPRPRQSSLCDPALVARQQTSHRNRPVGGDGMSSARKGPEKGLRVVPAVEKERGAGSPPVRLRKRHVSGGGRVHQRGGVNEEDLRLAMGEGSPPRQCRHRKSI